MPKLRAGRNRASTKRLENCMKKSIGFVLLTGSLALATSTANAQSTNTTLRATFALKATIQTVSGVASARVVNKDILAALNASGAYHFGPKATLLFVSTDEEPPLLIVREGTGQQTTDTDVSDFFGVTEVGDPVRSGDGGMRWETWNFAFNNGTTNETAFELWGETTIQQGTPHARHNGEGAGSPAFRSDVRGVGRLTDEITIFSGTIHSGDFAPVGNGR